MQFLPRDVTQARYICCRPVSGYRPTADWRSGPMVPMKNPGHSLTRLLSEWPTSVALPTSHHFHPSSPVVSLSLGILHEWMRMQTLAKPSSNLLQGTGGDHRGGRAQFGWRTFITTSLRWILGYERLEIWRKIGLSGDWCLCTALRTRSGACYYWIVSVSLSVTSQRSSETSERIEFVFGMVATILHCH